MLARPLGPPVWAGVATAALGGVGLLGLVGWFAAPAPVERADELLRRLPPALAAPRDRLDDTPLKRLVLEEIGLGAVMARLGPHAAGAATTAVWTAAGGLMNALHPLFPGVFLAASLKPAEVSGGRRRDAPVSGRASPEPSSPHRWRGITAAEAALGISSRGKTYSSGAGFHPPLPPLRHERASPRAQAGTPPPDAPAVPVHRGRAVPAGAEARHVRPGHGRRFTSRS